MACPSVDETKAEEKSHLNENDTFSKIMTDFIGDLQNSFPEFNEKLSINFDENKNLKTNDLQDHCKKLYPERFFDILYKNESMIDEVNLEILPTIHIKELWYIDGITENMKTTIWKYLQLILFSLIGNIDDKNVFGDTTKLFEAINEDDLKKQMENTMKDLFEMFQQNDNEECEESTNDEAKTDTPPEFLNPENVQEHLSSLLEGKLGQLASEIAEETANELNIDMDNVTNSQDVMKKLISNPSQLMNLVKKVGGKLDDKIKNGDIKESELMEEAGEIMKKMKDMPGMKDMNKLFKNMGMPSMGKNMKVNTAAINNQLRKQEAIDRVRKKAKARVQKQNEEKAIQEEYEKKRIEFMEKSGFTNSDGEMDIDKLMEALELNDNDEKKEPVKKKKKKKNKK